MNRVLSLLVLPLCLTLILGRAHAYQAIQVHQGGTIQGKVLVKGNHPADGLLQIPQEIDACDHSQKANRYLISKDRGVKNVVVWIKEIQQGKAVEKRDLKLSNVNCRFAPLVSIGYVGGRFLFTNHDPILHQMHLCRAFPYQKKVSQRPLFYGATVYNVALPIARLEIAKEIRPEHKYTEEGGYMKLICNRHPWMRGYIFVFDHPYAALTGDTGEFEIRDIPPGRYTLSFWHEGLKRKERVLEIQRGKTAPVRVEMER